MKLRRREIPKIILKRRIKKETETHKIKIRRRLIKNKLKSYIQTKVTESDNLRNIRKYIDKICTYGYRPYQVFVDWIELIFWAFQRNDPNYLKVMDRYKNSNDKSKMPNRPADYFAKMLGSLMLHMKETNEEVLGHLYSEYAMNARTGQFFTPPSLSNLMASLLGNKLKGNICDPACGAGGTLIACCKNMKNRDIDKSCFYGQDVDFTCVQMTALNLMFFNLPGVIIYGDTLKIEAKKVFITKRSYVLGGSLHEDPNPEKWQESMRNMFKFKLRRRKK